MSDKMKKIFILCFISILLLNESFSKDFWERVNVPNDTDVRDISFLSNGNMLVGGFGMYLSTDSGNKWNDISLLEYQGQIVSLSTLPVMLSSIYAVNDSLFLGSFDDGFIIKSTNSGVLWEMMDSKLQNINSFLKTNQNRIFANRDYSLFYSDDFGKSWTKCAIWINQPTGYSFDAKIKLSPDGKLFASNKGVWIIDPETLEGNKYTEGIDSSYIRCFAFGNGKVFAGTDTSGIYVSADNGQTWANLPNSPRNVSINVLEVTQSGKLVAGSEDGGLFYSTDEATNRQNENSEFGNYKIYDIEIKDDIIYLGSSGMFFSTDDGENWLNMPSNPGYPIVTLIEKDINSNFHLITINNLYHSKDNLQSWEKIGFDNDIDKMFRRCITDDGKIFVSTFDDRFLISTDGGKTFNDAPFDPEISYVIQIKKSKNGYIYFDAYGKNHKDLLYYSKDNGTSWQKINVNNVINYFGIGSNEEIIIIDNEMFLFISEDFGNTWKEKKCLLLSEVDSYGIESVEISGDNIFFGTDGKGIIRSSDYGETWFYSNNGINSIFQPNNIRIMDIKLIGDKIYASSNSGLFTLNPSDTVWTLEESGLIPSHSILIKYLNDKHIYVTTATGVYRSTDEITSVDDEVIKLEGNNFSISPNPAGDFIKININNGASFIASDKVQIFNMLGIEVLIVGTGLDLSSQRIDISTLPSGVYYIRIGDKVEKFVKM